MSRRSLACEPLRLVERGLQEGSLVSIWKDLFGAMFGVGFFSVFFGFAKFFGRISLGPMLGWEIFWGEAHQKTVNVLEETFPIAVVRNWKPRGGLPGRSPPGATRST